MRALLIQVVVLVPWAGRRGSVSKFSIPWSYQFVLCLQERGIGWTDLGRDVVAAEGTAVTLGSIPQSPPVAGIGAKSKKLPGIPSLSVCNPDFPCCATKR